MHKPAKPHKSNTFNGYARTRSDGRNGGATVALFAVASPPLYCCVFVYRRFQRTRLGNEHNRFYTRVRIYTCIQGSNANTNGIRVGFHVFAYRMRSQARGPSSVENSEIRGVLLNLELWFIRIHSPFLRFWSANSFLLLNCDSFLYCHFRCCQC